MGDARVVDENIEPAELVADPVRGGGDRGLIGDVELDRVRVAVDALCGRLTVGEVARADQHSQAVLGEIRGDRESDPLVGPRDQRNLVVMHRELLGASGWDEPAVARSDLIIAVFRREVGRARDSVSPGRCAAGARAVRSGWNGRRSVLKRGCDGGRRRPSDRVGASRPRAVENRLLSLQRTVGNAAVTRLVRDRRVLARCGGGRCSCGGTCGQRDPEVDEGFFGAERNALKRAAAARAVQRDATIERGAPARRRRQLQRVPSVALPFFSPTYNPGAASAWTQRVPCTGLRDPDAIERCQSDCPPYGDAVTASFWWHTVAEAIDAILEGSIPQATNGAHFLLCSDVHSAFHAYLTGTGTPLPLAGAGRLDQLRPQEHEGGHRPPPGGRGIRS